MKKIKLNNNTSIPVLGFGTFQISKQDCTQAVLDALEIGYRHIDTAQGYFNEEKVGEALSKSSIKREDIFLTTKIWVDNFIGKKAYESIESSLKKLKTDYIDLVLIHHPFSDYYNAYRTLEKFYKDGKIKALGISNFRNDRVEDLMTFNEIKPVINQIEINPFYQQEEERKYLKSRNIAIEAWAPLAQGRNDIFNNEVLLNIAKNHSKSVAQVVLNYLVSQDIITLVKSVHKNRIKENFDIFDFELTENEKESIKNLDTKSSLFFNDDTVEGVQRMEKVILERRKLS